MTTSTQHFADPAPVHERRLHPRVLTKSLIYVACGEANGGMVLNASDDGLAISMAIAVGDESFSNLHVRMNGLPEGIEVHGRMVWTTKSKKRAGIQLVDVTESQREQIREWIALDEGVRDVNLLPRVAAENLSGERDVSSGGISPVVLAEPHSSLLAAFGGSAPESLGPVTQGAYSSAGARGETEPSQGFDSLNPGGFRESEWDLAAVTLIPRKKVRPEGLSAFALMLLWIAIPSFAIGILVGRRPIEQWLSRGDAIGKSISRVAKRGTQALNRPGRLSAGGSGDAMEGPEQAQSSAPVSADSSRATDSPVFKSADAYESPDSRGTVVDTKLLNSVSTREARALIDSNAVHAKKDITPKAIAKVDRNANPAGRGSVALETANLNPHSAAPMAASPTGKTEISSGLVAHDAGSTNAKSTAPSIPAANSQNSIGQGQSGQSSSERVSKTISVDSGLDSAGAKNQTVADRQPSSSNVKPSTAVTRSVPAATAPAPAILTTARQDNNVPALGSTTISSQGINTAPPGAEISSSTASAPSRNNVAGGTAKLPPTPMSASNAATMGVAPSSPRPLAPTAAPSLAPTTTQPPLHGVLLVARKNDETFLLKLPVESVTDGHSTAIRMQRSVMVPPQSRWHRRGPIAKLTVGELITHVAPDQPDSGTKPRVGDVVSVRVFVGKDGSVLDLKPMSGRFALMPRVMRAVRDWQYEPTLLDGKPVESEVQVTVEFQPIH